MIFLGYTCPRDKSWTLLVFLHRNTMNFTHIKHTWADLQQRMKILARLCQKKFMFRSRWKFY